MAEGMQGTFFHRRHFVGSDAAQASALAARRAERAIGALAGSGHLSLSYMGSFKGLTKVSSPV